MNILIVDSYPMMVKTYERLLLRDLRITNELKITTAKDSREAYDRISGSENNIFDFAILEQNLHPYKEMGILSGADVINLLRKKHGDCKILIITSHTEVLVVYDILKKAKPDGLATKNDITEENFGAIVLSVLSGNLFQSALVKSCIDKVWKSKIMAEENNRQILLLLSKGYRIEDMQPALKLAPRTIERKMGEIRRSFGVQDNLNLIRVAVKDGLV